METVHVVAINPYRKGNKGKVFSYNIDTYDKFIGSKEIKKMIQQIRGEFLFDGGDLNFLKETGYELIKSSADFEVDMIWENNQSKEATVRSGAGGNCVIKYGNKMFSIVTIQNH